MRGGAGSLRVVVMTVTKEELREPVSTPADSRRIVETPDRASNDPDPGNVPARAGGVAAVRVPMAIVRRIVRAVAEAGQSPTHQQQLLLGPNGGLHWH